LIAAFIDDPSFATLPASCVEHFEKSTRPPVWPDRLGAHVLIEVENVAKAFGRRRDVRAVDGVSFAAADGEITGLLGPTAPARRRSCACSPR
jgi:hypothetical protein